MNNLAKDRYRRFQITRVVNPVLHDHLFNFLYICKSLTYFMVYFRRSPCRHLHRHAADSDNGHRVLRPNDNQLVSFRSYEYLQCQLTNVEIFLLIDEMICFRLVNQNVIFRLYFESFSV